MYDNRYIAQKLSAAVYSLATGQGDARSRLEPAFRKFWLIPINDFPSHLQETRKEIDSLLTRLPSREGFEMADNLQKMKNSTASKIAALIFSLYAGVLEVENAKLKELL
jgi:hypothetical protein